MYICARYICIYIYIRVYICIYIYNKQTNNKIKTQNIYIYMYICNYVYIYTYMYHKTTAKKTHLFASLRRQCGRYRGLCFTLCFTKSSTHVVTSMCPAEIIIFLTCMYIHVDKTLTAHTIGPGGQGTRRKIGP